MSNDTNTQLLARAHEAAEYVLGTAREEEIYRAIEDSDLEELERLVSEVEATMSQEHFHNYDVIPPSYNPSDDATVLSDIRGEIEASDVY